MNPIRLDGAQHLSARLPRFAMDRVWRRLVRFYRQVEFVYARQRQRIALGRLDERLLRDVGLMAEQARREAAKPPWRN